MKTGGCPSPWCPCPKKIFMNEIQPFLELLQAKHGWLAAIAGWIGFLRVAAKPFGNWLQSALSKFIASAPDYARACVDNRAYQLFAFVVDLSCSVKLPTAVSVVRQIEEEKGKARLEDVLGVISIFFGLGAAIAAGFLVAGCQKVDRNGVYGADPVLYHADKTITTGYDALRAFLKWELHNRETLKQFPEIGESSDFVRANIQDWIQSAKRLREAYSRNPTEDTRAALQRSLDVISTALLEAHRFRTEYQTK